MLIAHCPKTIACMNNNTIFNMQQMIFKQRFDSRNCENGNFVLDFLVSPFALIFHRVSRPKGYIKIHFRASALFTVVEKLLTHRKLFPTVLLPSLRNKILLLSHCKCSWPCILRCNEIIYRYREKHVSQKQR